MSSLPVPHLTLLEDRAAYDAAPKTAGFTMIPEPVRALKDGYALAVYEAIARHHTNGLSWPSIATLCDYTGWSKKIVIPAIQRLIDAGVIAKEKRFANGMKQSNQYRITAYVRMVPTEPTLSPTGPTLAPMVTLDGSYGDSGCHPGNHNQYVNDQELTDQDGVNSPPPPKDAGPDFDADFWPGYPKGRGSKKDAKTVWSRLSVSDRRAAVAALPLFAAGRDWQTGFHCGPEVWLRGRRWENPPPPWSGDPPPLRDKLNGHKPNGRRNGGMTPEEILAYGRGEYDGEQGGNFGDFVDVRGRVVERRDHPAEDRGLPRGPG